MRRWVLLLVAMSGCATERPFAEDGGVSTDAGDACIDGVSGCDASVVDDAGVDAGDVPRRPCLGGESRIPGSENVHFGRFTATASITSTETEPSCVRRYHLTSDAPKSDAAVDDDRAVDERPGQPFLRTGHVLFDALYALALEEARENSVEQIEVDSFNDGRPIECPPGGCFETGEEWTYVWTRDTAYSVHLGLALLDPVRARNSLEFKLSLRRDGTGLEVVQDTGSGGSYPVSTDRVVFFLGASEVEKALLGAEREAFRSRVDEALLNTIEHDRRVVFDEEDGLYRGETSFLDWRQQTYPSFTADDVVPIVESKALSTNVLHWAAIDEAARRAEVRGDGALALRYRSWATALRERIRTRFDLGEGGLASFVNGPLDLAPTRKRDLLGLALAVLFDIVPPERGRALLSQYPHTEHGPPVVFPEAQDTPIYHNRAVWPFVTAYALKAARHVGHVGVVTHDVLAMMRASALNLSNMENLEMVTGLPHVEEGSTSGPKPNSRRQLWSVAGYVGMVHSVLFGIELTETGVSIRPFIPEALRDALFAGASELVLNDVPIRGKRLSIRLVLPEASEADDSGTGVLKGHAWALDGRPSASVLLDDQLSRSSLLEIQLSRESAASAPPLELPVAGATDVHLLQATMDYQTIFAPRTPEILRLVREGATVRVELSTGGEDGSGVVFDLFRDGVEIARGLPGHTTSFIDTPPAEPAASSCYAIETRFLSSGLTSHRSRARCDWGASSERITTLSADSLVVRSVLKGEDGPHRFVEFLDDDAGEVMVEAFVPNESGRFLIQLVASNDAGPVSTGITCAVLRVDVVDAATGKEAGGGYAVIPHGARGSWRESSAIVARLTRGSTYRIRLFKDRWSVNMSTFDHFARYTGGAGGKAPHNRAKVSGIKLLWLGG